MFSLLLFLTLTLTSKAQEAKDLFDLLDALKITTVHLTFDDGPNPKYTPEVLDILKDNNLKANFFLVGTNVKAYPNLVERIVREGHDLGGHSMTHKELTKIPFEKAKLEILDSMKEVRRYKFTDLFRFPYGSFNDRLVQVLTDAGFRNIYWDVDTTDWKYKDKEVILKKFKLRLERSRDGAVVLLHDIHPQTVESLKLIVKYLRDRKIKVTKIP